MSRASDAILGRARVREVAGVFHSYETLDAAVEGLLLAGFDRADLDRMAPIDEVYDKVGAVFIAPEELADVPYTPRQPVVLPADTGATTALVASVAAGVAGLGMALIAVMLDYTSAQGAVAALIAAVVAGGVAGIAALRIFKREKITGLDTLMTERGIVLWVRVRTPEREEMAQKVLRDHGAQAIRVHEIEIDKTAKDLPLSKLRPDPWLSNERLGDL
jgi:hypothetical protein